MSHRDTDQPRVDRDLLDQLVRENGLTPDYINDAERQDREAAREWLNESVFDWMLLSCSRAGRPLTDLLPRPACLIEGSALAGWPAF